MKERIRHPFNYYLGRWDEKLRGYFVEIEPTDPHPTDCVCVECMPRLSRPYREYDELDAKQAKQFWK